jgi:hypothetical protein
MIAAALLVLLLPPEGLPTARGGSLAERSWVSEVVYFNPTDQEGDLRVDFRSHDGTLVSTPPVAVAGRESGEILVGTTLPAPFSGSGTLVSSFPLAAVLRQEGDAAAPTAAMVYTSYLETQAGDGGFFLPWVTKGAAVRTLLGIQNLEEGEVVLSLTFHPAASASPPIAVDLPTPVPALASAVVDLADVTELPDGFSGSLVIRGRQSSSATAASVVAAAQALFTSGRQAYAYDGTGVPASRLHLPDAVCTVSKGITTSSTFYLQNAGVGDATFSVDYFYPVRVGKRTVVKRATVKTRTVAPGRMTSVKTCATRAVKGKKGVVAVVSSADADGNPVPAAALDVVSVSGTGVVSAYAAAPSPVAGPDGRYRTVLPGVEWARATPGYRTTLTVMNASPRLGTAPGKKVTLTYFDGGGTSKVATATCRTSLVSNPSSARALPAGADFRGGVVVESSFPFVAAARVVKLGTKPSDGFQGLGW